MNQGSLVGTWRLVSYEVRIEGRAPSYPLGPDAAGYITYTADGHMSTMMMTANRPRFSSENPLLASKDEKAAAADTCVGYCGRYEVVGGEIIHHTEVSTVPNWVGVDQRRSYDIQGDELILSVTLPFKVDGRSTSLHVTWKRA